MQFDLFRISLAVREQALIFERQPDGTLPTREQFLRNVFSNDFKFKGQRGGQLEFVALNGLAGPEIIAGRIGRKKHVAESAPPEADLRPIKRETWQSVLLFIDPRHHSDGQKLVIQFKQQVASTRSLATSIAAYLNQLFEGAPYTAEIREIVDPRSFWEFVDENMGEITSLEFEFVTPNMFGIRSKIDEELRSFRDEERARTADVRLWNPEGLNIQTERVKKSVDYATEGGGRIKARARNRSTYNSISNGKRLTTSPEMDETLLSELPKLYGEERIVGTKEQVGPISRLVDWLLG